METDPKGQRCPPASSPVLPGWGWGSPGSSVPWPLAKSATVSKDQILCSQAHSTNIAFPAAGLSGPLVRDFTPFVPISLHYLQYSSSPAN